MAPAHSPDVLGFLHLVADELDDALDAAADAPVARAGAAALRDHLRSGPEVRPFEPVSIPAVAALEALPEHRLADSVREIASELPWQPSHRVDDDGANIGLVMLDDCLDVGDLGLGIMLVGPHDAYPEHRHPPAEVYLVLGGTAEWRFGGSDRYVERSAGDIVFNHPHDLHGVRTGTDPTVALWVLYPDAPDSAGEG